MARPPKYISRARRVVIEEMRAKGEAAPDNIPYKDLADLVSKHYRLEWSGSLHVAYAVIARLASPLHNLRPRNAGENANIEAA